MKNQSANLNGRVNGGTCTRPVCVLFTGCRVCHGKWPHLCPWFFARAFLWTPAEKKEDLFYERVGVGGGVVQVVVVYAVAAT